MSTIQIGGVNARFYFAGGYVWIPVTDSAQWGYGGFIYLQHKDKVYYLAPGEIVYHSKTQCTVSGIMPDGSAIVEILLTSASTLAMSLSFEVTSTTIPDEIVDFIMTEQNLKTANPYCRIIPRGKLVPLEDV